MDAIARAIQGRKDRRMSDLISRKGVFIPDITVEMFRNASLESIEDLMASGEMEDILLPSAQPDIDKQELTRMITAGIIATNTKDVYSCGMRNGMRWCRGLLEEDAPKFEDASLYAQPETHDKRTETHACDLISRQALCEYALNQKDKCVTPNDIMRFPSAQPEEVTPHQNYKYLSDYWCECGWHLGKKGEVKYCSECGRKVNWDG